jgi:myo-inositol-1(or 4)-monophosphatase
MNELDSLLRTAGRMMLDYQSPKVFSKGHHADFVTEADIAVQSYLVDALQRAYPRAKFLAEEEERHVLTDALTFIIDPIDGTTNYFRRRRCSMISIGAVENKLPVFGGLYDPYLDEMYLAERGKGATCNGERIRVSDTSLDKALIGFGSAPYYEELFSLTGRTVSTLLPKIADVRRWDYCAGTLLIEEAGGRCGDIRGGSVVYDRPMAHMAANARIFDNLREVLQSADCENPDSMV